MEQNRISERGSYDELLRHNGAFAQFMRTHLTELVANDEEGEKTGLQFLTVTYFSLIVLLLLHNYS